MAGARRLRRRRRSSEDAAAHLHQALGARSPRATSTSATSAATRSGTPTPASAAPAATTSCSRSASTPSACRPSSAAIAGGELAERVGEQLRRAHEGPARASGLLLRLVAVVHELRPGACTAGRSGCSWTLLEAGLIYRGTGTVDWCENCQTTLASIQVEPGGTCWRCHEPVRADRHAAVVPGDQRLRARRTTRRLAELEDSGIWDEVALASQQYVLGTDRRRRARAARRRGRGARALHPLPRRARRRPASC